MFDLIVYFDAFGARVQPDLWTEAIFKRMFKATRKHTAFWLPTAAKGSVRRAMQAVGFRRGTLGRTSRKTRDVESNSKPRISLLVLSLTCAGTEA